MPRQSRQSIGDASPQDLAVIAGLPAPAYNAATSAASAAFPRWKFIATPFPNDFGRIYDRRSTLKLLEAICDFADAQTKASPPRPARMVLIYVADPSVETLFEGFGFGALPIRLEAENWEWPDGEHWRKRQSVVNELVLGAVASTERDGLLTLRERLQRALASEPLLLPPRNFKTAEGALETRFHDLMRNENLPDDTFADVPIETFTFENLKRFFAKVPEHLNDFRLDTRGLVFARSFSGQHGNAWKRDVKNLTLAEFRLLLEETYRFGTPVKGGFQHDVQWRDNRRLKSEPFYDIEEKDILISDTHADIYPSDKVRGKRDQNKKGRA